MTNYPKVQYSIFPAGDKSKQFVLRGESIEEVKQLKKDLDENILAKMEAKTQEELGVCEKCGSPKKLSKKGDPYCSKTCWLPKT